MRSEKNLKNRAYLVDASIYIFRAWYSYPVDVTDSQGCPVNAVHGYADFLTSLLHQLKPRHIACAFDGSLATSFRNEIYPAYKANREPAPAELKYQFDLCRRLTRALGISEYSSDRFEADDILGSMASMMATEGHPVTIITSDKDLTQLLLLALAGDTVDNIPGIPGIGAKTAAGLLQRYRSLEGIYEHLHEVDNCGLRGAARIRKLLTEHENDARLARRLTVVSDQALTGNTPSCLRWKGINREQLEEVSDDLGVSKFRRRQWAEIKRD